jgi:DNA (cytosine-5)-methyltransferase 1
MGYKLAGYNVIGGVEIDPRMMALYRANHGPKYSYMMGIQDFNKVDLAKLPGDLFNIDILDGSPPCSVFSTSGARDKKWGSEHKFREGQAAQRLDDLFFHFIETGARLQPRVIIAENVKGLILGKARGYVKEIFSAFRDAGYDAQLFLLNAARMGVPQARERTFFIARRRNLGLDPIKLDFNESIVTPREALSGFGPVDGKISKEGKRLWLKTKAGRPLSDAHPTGSWFNEKKIDGDRPSNTIASSAGFYHWDEPRHLTDMEIIRLQTFPDDYNFLKENVQYVCGMSVPPLMTQRVALEIYHQWFNVIADRKLKVING